MTMFKRFVTVVAALFLVATVGFAQANELPKVYILATGGTIAGSGSSATNSNYTAGQVAIGTLIDAVPAMKEIADIEGEQVVYRYCPQRFVYSTHKDPQDRSGMYLRRSVCLYSCQVI